MNTKIFHSVVTYDKYFFSSHSPWRKPTSLNVCIRYDDVNRALAKAKKRHRKYSWSTILPCSFLADLFLFQNYLFAYFDFAYFVSKSPKPRSIHGLPFYHSRFHVCLRIVPKIPKPRSTHDEPCCHALFRVCLHFVPKSLNLRNIHGLPYYPARFYVCLHFVPKMFKS